MSDLPIFKPVLQRGKCDCTIAVLASLTSRTYEEVLVQAVLLNPEILKQGLHSTQVMEIAKIFGVTLKRRTKRIDVEEMSGILELRRPDGTEHVVLLTNGLLFDPVESGNVWDADIYFKTGKTKIIGLLEEK